MLQSLEGLERDEAAQLLSAATRTLSPNPDVERPARREHLPELTQKLISELRDQLHLRADDNSPRAQARLFETLASYISQYILAGNVAEIRKTLGQQGELAPPQYKIFFGEGVDDFCEGLGLRKKQINEAVLRPDRVEHLLRDKVESGNAPAVSLYTSQVGIPGTKDSYTLLVHTIRQGDAQKVNAAFRIFHSEVAIDRKTGPLDTLRAFVEVYGLPFRIGPIGPTKFVLYETRPQSIKSLVAEGLKIAVEHPADHLWHIALGLFRQNALDTLEVAVAYAIDMEAYTQDLGKHGIRTLARAHKPIFRVTGLPN